MLYNIPQEASKLREEKKMTESGEGEIHDFYFDGTQITVHAFGVNISYTLSNPHPKDQAEAMKANTQAVTRTSLEHAKVLAMLLKKQIKDYEFRTKIDIKVPDAVYQALQLDSNDW
jgi:hypothetical protein